MGVLAAVGSDRAPEAMLNCLYAMTRISKDPEALPFVVQTLLACFSTGAVGVHVLLQSCNPAWNREAIRGRQMQGLLICSSLWDCGCSAGFGTIRNKLGHSCELRCSALLRQGPFPSLHCA